MDRNELMLIAKVQTNSKPYTYKYSVADGYVIQLHGEDLFVVSGIYQTQIDTIIDGLNGAYTSGTMDLVGKIIS